jgi:hypothetical protein
MNKQDAKTIKGQIANRLGRHPAPTLPEAENMSTLEEGLRLIGKLEHGNREIKLYKDTDWGEFRVKFYIDGEHQTEADYHTDDKQDASDTARSFLSKAEVGEGQTTTATPPLEESKNNELERIKILALAKLT